MLKAPKGLVDYFFKLTAYIVVIGDAFYCSTANAAVPTIQTLLTNLISAHDDLMRMVTAIGFVMGMAFVMKSLILLRKYGESRTMMSTEFTLKGPLIYMAVGTALLYLPSSIHSGIATIFGSPNPYAYVADANDQWSDLIKSCFVIVEIIGVISFIRGLIIMTHLGGGHAQHGTLGKAMAHIIGGVLCINMYQFIQALINTIGYGQ